ncbi:ArsR family transcriptional regulator [Anaerobacillus alkaliphilus]|uniref:ArsR family transcriptional regulator n=1 Tax=Anaerobacillus alkaliphilus TaxID=1548597 RepID=A0A4Q0W0D5_9BACI|nr:helix-turn-helix domain-containing protein [Anaerobacillus alkaliphilus]RXJ04231.1 ArsR family transcriptional regulator [Anaerobacillus alkaliphilus]
MTMSKADVILHPVRMKIIQSLIKRPLIVQELMEWLPEVPQATLYRQLKILTESKVIYVKEERKVRGTVERTYALNNEVAHVSAEEANKLTKDDHMKYFITYFANLLQGVEEYLEGDDIDMAQDGFGYRKVDLFLNAEEFQEFREDLVNVFKKHVGNEPNGERRKRSLATIFIPEKK